MFSIVGKNFRPERCRLADTMFETHATICHNYRKTVDVCMWESI